MSRLWFHSHNPWRIHGADIYANIKGVYIDGIHGTPYIAAPWIRPDIAGWAPRNITANEPQFTGRLFRVAEIWVPKMAPFHVVSPGREHVKNAHRIHGAAIYGNIYH
jgi:hypothetical protein